MKVHDYNGFMVAVVDDGESLRVVEPKEVYAPWQVEEVRQREEFLGQPKRDYGKLNHLPHILVGSGKLAYNPNQNVFADLALFKFAVTDRAREFATGHLEILEQVFRRTKSIEVLSTTR